MVSRALSWYFSPASEEDEGGKMCSFTFNAGYK